MRTFKLWLGRMLKFYGQRLARGWDDSELWDLNVEISRFVLPRLIRHRDVCPGCPWQMEESEWKSIQDDMIYFHEQTIKLYEGCDYDVDEDRYERGREMFMTYYNSLGW